VRPTQEYENGIWVTRTAPFRVYHNIAERAVVRIGGVDAGQGGRERVRHVAGGHGVLVGLARGQQLAVIRDVAASEDPGSGRSRVRAASCRWRPVPGPPAGGWLCLV
jgi:hypothetical protein